jgi:F5/8 type C domain
MIILVSNLSSNALFVNALKFHAKNEPEPNVNNNPPVVKLVFNGNFYDMLPFIVVRENELKRLNFPQDADGGDVPIDKLPKMSSNDQISFSFATKPRELNAYAIDYDADTTEMTPLKRIGEYQFELGDINGIKTLELRVIYPNGMYATYTLLFNIEKADKISNQEISTHIIQMHNNDSILDDANINSQVSNNVNSEGYRHGAVTIEEHRPNEYNETLKWKEEHDQKVQNYNAESFVPESSNECTLSEIPVAGVQTDSSIKNSNDSEFGTSGSRSSQISLDLGHLEKICGIKALFDFENGPDQIRYFTMEFSNDGQNYTGKEYYSTSATTIGPEIYTLKNGPVDARFVKVTELGRPYSEEWIREVKILG